MYSNIYWKRLKCIREKIKKKKVHPVYSSFKQIEGGRKCIWKEVEGQVP